MDHIALNGTGTNDSDFNDKVVKCARTHTRQKIHLRAALDLKDAERIGDTEHIIDFRVFLRNRRQCVRLALPRAQKMKGLADTGQHTEGEDINFQHANFINIILIPLNDGAVCHGCILYRAHLIEAACCNHKAADMLRQMPWEADNLMCKL